MRLNKYTELGNFQSVFFFAFTLVGVLCEKVWRIPLFRLGGGGRGPVHLDVGAVPFSLREIKKSGIVLGNIDSQLGRGG